MEMFEVLLFLERTEKTKFRLKYLLIADKSSDAE